MTVDYERLWTAVGGRPGLTQWYGDPRKLWPSETRHFVPWLIDNLGLLSRCLALPLTFVGREATMGGAQHADILVTDDDGRRIVIEAQMGSSDNNHLGKLPVYGLMGKADLVVWVLAHDSRQLGFQAEHTRTMHMLNERLIGLMQFAAVAVTLESDLYPGTGLIDGKVPALIPRLRRFDLDHPDLRPDPDTAIPPLIVAPPAELPG